MNETDALKDGYIDLRINNLVKDSRNKYQKEYEIISQINDFLSIIQKETEKKGTEKQNVYITVSLIEIQKLYCSAVLLFERGLPESANIIIRTLLELTFKIVEVIRNKEFVEDLLVNDFYEGRNILLEIEDHKLYNLIPKNLLEKLLTEYEHKINGKNRPKTKVNYLKEKNNMSDEYIIYRLQCDYSHFSMKILGEDISILDDIVLINGNFKLDKFKSSILWLISIVGISIRYILEEYLEDENIINDYQKLKKRIDEYLINN